jgi:hypothetical protein
MTPAELKSIRECVSRNRPFGSEQWTEEIADRHGLWSSLRPKQIQASISDEESTPFPFSSSEIAFTMADQTAA